LGSEKGSQGGLENGSFKATVQKKKKEKKKHFYTLGNDKKHYHALSKS
jgi:hypothetical protein